MKRNILITGGAGFIGSHVVRLFVGKYPDYRIINLDRLTYAGNLANLRDVENRPNYTFVKGDICDYDAMRSLFAEYDIDGVIHLAAESHVDRSIRDPFTFARTNVMGTLTLLQAAREHWNGTWEGRRFHHISTDEVYGALPFDGTLFTEQTRYDPHSPYSASKASSDHFVRAFHDTYGFPAVVTNCSNNYGPISFPRSSYRCSSTTSATKSRCRSTAGAKTSATGSTSRTTPGPSTRYSTGDATARRTTSAVSTSGGTST